MNDEDPTATEIRRMLTVCPACHQSCDAHSYALFATTVAVTDRGSRLREFLDTLKKNDWAKAMEFQEFEGSQDAAEAYAVRCVSGPVILLIIRSPFELFEPGEILSREVLEPSSGKALVRLIQPDAWANLSAR
jgi:hypothetical protein